MVGRERTQHFRERDGEPAVAASPIMVAHVGVEKQSVRLLQFVEVGGEFGRGVVGVFRVVRRAIRLDLQNPDHEAVVHPVARFARGAVGQRIFPLLVRLLQTEREIIRVAVQQINLQRQRAKDVKINVPVRRDGACCLPA